MRFSITLTDYTWPEGGSAMGAHLGDVARAADEAGIDTVWVADHLLQADPMVPDDTEMLEAMATLGFLAAHSERVRLGTLVAAATYRPPALLLKAVTTLDVLSGGRAWLGVGAGYLDDEALAMGLPLPPSPERFEHLEDLLRMAHHVWSADATEREAPFHGMHHTLQAPVFEPAPISSPHPPILVGGTGERRTLKLVAQYADACNLFDIPDGGTAIRHKLDVLRQHCVDVGRPWQEVETTVSTRMMPGQSREEFAGHCADLADLGIDHVILLASGVYTREAVEALAPTVKELEPVAAASRG